MLFQTSIRRELGKNFAATLVILSIIVLTMALLRVLAQATRGAINPTDILMVLAYTMLGNFSILLALSLLICIVHTLSRMAADSELVIWYASGKGPWDMVSPVFRFAWPILIAIGTLTLLIWPWSNSQSQKLKDQYSQRNDIERVTPGQFQESTNNNRVVYIDNQNGANQSRKNLFVHDTTAVSETIITAKSGEMQTTNGRQYLILNSGQRVIINSSPKSVSFVEFDRLGNFVKNAPLTDTLYEPPKAKSSRLLIRAPNLSNLGELAWRIGLIAAGLNFVILGVLLSASPTNRQRKSMHYIYAILVFVTYYNFINFGQNWIANGKISFASWLLGLHGLIFIVACLGISIQHNAWRLSVRIPKRLFTS